MRLLERPYPHGIGRRNWLLLALGVVGALLIAFPFDRRLSLAGTGLPDSVRGFFFAITDIGLADWILIPVGRSLRRLRAPCAGDAEQAKAQPGVGPDGPALRLRLPRRRLFRASSPTSSSGSSAAAGPRFSTHRHLQLRALSQRLDLPELRLRPLGDDLRRRLRRQLPVAPLVLARDGCRCAGRSLPRHRRRALSDRRPRRRDRRHASAPMPCATSSPRAGSSSSTGRTARSGSGRLRRYRGSSRSGIVPNVSRAVALEARLHVGLEVVDVLKTDVDAEDVALGVPLRPRCGCARDGPAGRGSRSRPTNSPCRRARNC